MPDGSFGRAYADFMGSRSFRADDRPPVRFIADAELAYVALRARQVHDFWHVLFACPTTVLGELAIKAVEFIQVYSCRSRTWHCSGRGPSFGLLGAFLSALLLPL